MHAEFGGPLELTVYSYIKKSGGYFYPLLKWILDNVQCAFLKVTILQADDKKTFP